VVRKMRKVNALTLAGLMTGLHLLALIVLTYIPYLPIIEIFTYVLAPLASAIYTLRNKAKYTAIFIIATLISGFLFNPVYTLIYLVPILGIGVGYGSIVKTNLDRLRVVYLMGLVYIAVFFLTNFILRLVYNFDLAATIILFLNINESNYYLIYVLLVAYGLLQAVVLNSVLMNEIKKFGIIIPKFKDIYWFDIIMSVIFVVVALFYSGQPEYEFLFSFISVLFAIPIMIYGYRNKFRNKNLIILSFGFSALLMVLPLIAILPVSKYLLAFLFIFTPFFMLGIRRFIRLYYVKPK
jgi:hypothetical protein